MLASIGVICFLTAEDMESAHDPAVRLWDSATGREMGSLSGPAETIVSTDFTPDGASLIAGDNHGYLTLWDLKSRRPRHSWKVHRNWIMSVAFSVDGRTLASAGDETVKLWAMPADGLDPQE